MKLPNNVARLGCTCANHFTVSDIDVHEDGCPHFDPRALDELNSLRARDEGKQVDIERELEEDSY